MAEDAWDVVVHGVAIHQETLQVRNITIGWRGGVNACVMIFKGEVGQPTHANGITDVDVATAFLFGPDGGGGQPQSVAEVVNLDGSPRKRLLDRWRERWDVESSAAD